MRRIYQRALITGATSGIGKAFAEALPVETDLFLTGRDEAKLVELRDRFAVSGRTVEIVPADLRTPADRRRLTETAEAFQADLFVNNAGLGFFSRFVETSAEDAAASVASMRSKEGKSAALTPEAGTALAADTARAVRDRHGADAYVHALEERLGSEAVADVRLDEETAAALRAPIVL